MRLRELSIAQVDGHTRLTGIVDRTCQAAEFDLYFQFPTAYGEFVANSADALSVAMLVPAMHAGEPLEIVPPISPQLHFNLPRVRDVFHTWFPDLRRIEIKSAAAVSSPVNPKRRAASFFSGGVDSFFSLLRYQGRHSLPEPLTHIVLMRGIETELHRIKGIDETTCHAQAVANAVGVECIVGETNIRTRFPISWEKLYCGSGLAATALALSGGFDYVCIPSGRSYATLAAAGSSPLTDERFSTEYLRILHDGAETRRPDKTASILEWEPDITLRYLRVCTKNLGGAYNCGRCYKCVRTAMVLEALGAFGRANLFSDRSKEAWELLARTDSIDSLRESLAFVQQHAPGSDVARILERVVRGRAARASLRELAKNTLLRRLLWAAPSAWQR